jgi:hypothetical protein
VLGEPLDLAREVAAFLDGYLRRVPFMAALGLHVVVWAVIWLPLFFVGVPLTANALSPPVRARYIQRRIYFLREGFYLLKAVALMGWGVQGQVRARLDLGPVAAVRP